MPRDVIMPALGMVQDTGLLVAWHKNEGDKVSSGDILFEVETDKSTMEIEAQADGYLSHIKHSAGEEVPVGQVIAHITETAQTSDRTPPDDTPAKNVTTENITEASPSEPDKVSVKIASPEKTTPTPIHNDGKILASPKARRLALEQGLDLAELVRMGYTQPYHASDIETLTNLPTKTTQTLQAAEIHRITAQVDSIAFTDFLDWAKIQDETILLAEFAAKAMRQHPSSICIATHLTTRFFITKNAMSAVIVSDAPPPHLDLTIYDQRLTPSSEALTTQSTSPVMMITSTGPQAVALMLEYTNEQLSNQDATTLLTQFAEMLKQPLRRLL